MAREQVPLAEIRWSTSSGMDAYGRLFEWRGDVYRQVRPPYRDERRRVLTSPSVQHALGAGLFVATEETTLEVEPGDLVLRHRRVPVVSYPSEWSASMLKEAARLLLDLENLLIGDGLTIGDANPWNVLFEGPRPVFVDFGSITPLDDPVLWTVPGCDPLFPARQQFDRFFLDPLRVMAAGHDHLVRVLLTDYRGVSRVERQALTGSVGFVAKAAVRRAQAAIEPSLRDAAKAILPEATKQRLRRLLAAGRGAPGPAAPSNVPSVLPSPDHRRVKVAEYRRLVEEVPVTSAATAWATYYAGLHGTEVPGLEPDHRWTAKHHAAARVLELSSPAVCLDIGSNTGWYARLAERHGAYVIAADTDDGVISTLHRRAAESGLRILPLIFDLRSPTPGTGPLNKWLVPALERLQADLVFALALTHHLVFSQEMTFEQIAGTLAALCRRWLLVEFVPLTDEHIGDLAGPQHDWYREDVYVASFEKHFVLRDTFDSFPVNRRLFLFERRAESEA